MSQYPEIDNAEWWGKWGLSIHPSVYFEAAMGRENLSKCFQAHNMVATYMDKHPLEIPQLFNEKGEINYFEVLSRAEALQ